MDGSRAAGGGFSAVPRHDNDGLQRERLAVVHTIDVIVRDFLEELRWIDTREARVAGHQCASLLTNIGIYVRDTTSEAYTQVVMASARAQRALRACNMPDQAAALAPLALYIINE
jgi:hypothetical protein